MVVSTDWNEGPIFGPPILVSGTKIIIFDSDTALMLRLILNELLEVIKIFNAGERTYLKRPGLKYFFFSATIDNML